MANEDLDLTVADLERLLNSRKMKLEELAKRRSHLQKQLDALDSEISQLEGQRRGGPRGKRGRRPKNEKPLRTHVVELLSKNKKGYTLADLSAKVTEAGYRSGSTNFRNVLYQCLYNTKDIFHDEASGTYKIKTAVKETKEAVAK